MSGQRLRLASRPPRGRPLPGALAVALALLLAVLLQPAAVRGDSGSLAGDLPVGGGLALVAWSGGPLDDLRAAARSRGCEVISTWAFSGGAPVGHTTGAPPFVNAAFLALFPGGNLPQGTTLALVCRPTAEVAPAPRDGDAPGVYTIAGSGPPDVGDGGPATDAVLKRPHGLATAPDGSVFIADTEHNRIRQVLPGGTIRTVAGIGTAESVDPVDGVPATDSPIRLPRDVAVGPDGAIYIADSNFYMVRRVEPSTGIISTVAGNRFTYPAGDGGPAVAASLGFPGAVAVDEDGGLYIADHPHRVRYVDAGGTITTLLGLTSEGPGALNDPAPPCANLDGPAHTASIRSPSSLALDGRGGLLIGGWGSCGVLRLDLATRELRLLSTHPALVASSGNGDVYVIDTMQGIVRIDPHTRATSTIASAQAVQNPAAIAVDLSGTVYVADSGADVVWRVQGGQLTRFAGGGTVLPGSFVPDSQGIAVDPFGNVFLTDFHGHRIFRLSVDGEITVVAGTGTARIVDDVSGGDGGHPLEARFGTPQILRFDAHGNLFFIDGADGVGVVRRISPGASGVIEGGPDERITTVAGRLRPRSEADHGRADGGPATEAVFVAARDIVFDVAGNLYVADWLDHRLRKVTPGTDGLIAGRPEEVITTVAGDGTDAVRGDGGPASAASLPYPRGLAADAQGSIYIRQAILGGQAEPVRRIDGETGVITLVHEARHEIGQLAFGTDGHLYLSDRLRIFRVDLTTDARTPVAGSGRSGFNGDAIADPLEADFRGLGFFTFGADGHIYAVDNGNFRIVRIVLGR